MKHILFALALCSAPCAHAQSEGNDTTEETNPVATAPQTGFDEEYRDPAWRNIDETARRLASALGLSYPTGRMSVVGAECIYADFLITEASHPYRGKILRVLKGSCIGGYVVYIIDPATGRLIFDMTPEAAYTLMERTLAFLRQRSAPP